MASATPGDGSSTPAGEPDDDFFSSWDKPSIKRPTPPISRTATPSNVGRTPSPFLNAPSNGNSTARPKSPLAGTESASSTNPPTASRATSSTAVRKSTTTGAPRKANVLGAKKTQKLGAKKIAGADAIDFDAAEKKAKEEAERIEKLGYDPDAEEAATETRPKTGGASTEAAKIVSPTPLSPGKSFGSTQGRDRNSGEVERLGMAVGRLGFGQVGGGAPKTAAAAPKKMGFGSTSASKSTLSGKHALHSKTAISRVQPADAPSQRRSNSLDRNSEIKRAFQATNSLAGICSILARKQKPARVCKASRVRARSPATHTLADRRKRMAWTSMVTTATSRVLRETLSGSLASRLEMICRRCWETALPSFKVGDGYRSHVLLILAAMLRMWNSQVRSAIT